MFQRHRGKHHKQIHLCLFFLDGKHREPQSINAKLFLPIIPIGIVAYALTLCGTTFVETAVYIQHTYIQLYSRPKKAFQRIQKEKKLY